MPELKLPKLPDSTPVKLTISITPDLNRALADYAEVCQATYGQSEAVAELVPCTLRSFLDSGRAFARAREAPSKAGRGNG